MSLVNEMLKDLDKQSPARRPVPGLSEPLAQDLLLKKPSRVGTWLPALCGFAIVTVIILADQNRQEQDGQPLQQSQVSQPEEPLSERQKSERPESERQDLQVQQTQAILAPNYYSGVRQQLAATETAAVDNTLVEVQSASLDVGSSATSRPSVDGQEQATPVAAVAATTVETVLNDTVSVDTINTEMITAETNVTKAAEQVVQPIELVTQSAQQRQIDELLLAAEQAIRLERLTSPKGDNAFDRYRQVLALDTDNLQARAGLEMISLRYVQLAESYAAEGNPLRAQVLLRRAASVTPDHPQVQVLSERLGVMADSPQASATRPLAPVQQSLPTERVVDQHPQPEALSAELDATHHFESGSQLDSLHVRNSGVSVAPSQSWQDEEAVRRARQMIQQGEEARAEKLLKSVLAQNQRAEQSLMGLFDLYLRQGKSAKAQALLARGSYLAAYKRAKLTAQLYVSLGDLRAAVRVLSTHSPSMDDDASYYALLAGLQHKLGDYHKSANLYRRLLSEAGNKPAYWLGLAVALDALQDKANALTAFRQARQGRQAPDVQRYINERITALSS